MRIDKEQYSMKIFNERRIEKNREREKNEGIVGKKQIITFRRKENIQ